MYKMLSVMVISWCLGFAVPAESTAETNWLKRVISADRDERMSGHAMFERERRETVEALLKILKMPIDIMEDEYYLQYTPRNTAILILGRMRAPEAISVLLEYVAPLKGEGFEMTAFTIPPAAVALTRIGTPAVEPVEKQLLADVPSTEVVKQEYLMILVRILGKDVTEFRLQKKLELEKNTRVRELLERYLRWLNDGTLPKVGMMPLPPNE